MKQWNSLLIGLLSLGFVNPPMASNDRLRDPFQPLNQNNNFIKIEEQHSVKSPIVSGKRISLQFEHIPVSELLQTVAKFIGINVVVSDKVQGAMTLRLTNVPWEQALDIILTTQGLEKRQKGNLMWIDTKASLDTLEEAQLKSQQLSEKLEPIRSDLFKINYAKASDIVNLIKDKQSLLLSEQGKIVVDDRTNVIWVQDIEKKISAIKHLVKQLDVPVKQVLIEARLVEVSKDFSQDIGIHWSASKKSIPSIPTMNPTSLADKLNLDLLVNSSNLLNPATMGIALAKISDNILLDLELSALESEGRAELISSPRLITSDQQPALIESGQEIPYQETTVSGATTVVFKKAVLSLKVTPKITLDNQIVMDLQINQGSAAPQTVNGVPALFTKEIQTHILVNNGQTIVLGGIYIKDKMKSINRIPFFGELPLIGTLFRNQLIHFKNDEMLVFITPKIIKNQP